MLIEFSVQNYRSIAEKQTFSMATSSCGAKSKRFSFPTEYPAAPCLIKAACLLGPNGVGKTSFIKAVKFYRHFVVSSAKDTQEGESISVAPFLLDSELKNEPSEFEASFIHGEFLYQYGFAVNRERVVEEWLYAKPNKPRTQFRDLFHRRYSEKSDTYEWTFHPRHLKGNKEVWKESTRDNALFLSTAVQLKSETLKEPFDWIQWHFRALESTERLSEVFTLSESVRKDKKNDVLRMLQAVDLGISDLKINATNEKTSILQDTVNQFSSLVEKLGGSIDFDLGAIEDTEIELYEVHSVHTDRQGKPQLLDFDLESTGTRVLLGLAGPLLDSLENGYTLIVDELNNSLHPHALHFLVSMFLDEDINTGNAQLIFTTHETSVISKNFLHRDQIWFMEKERQATKLFPLSDFKVREFEAFQRAYLDGRYGAVPKIRDIANEKI